MSGWYIVRFFFGGKRRTIKRVASEALAQEHCSNPETSSRTCKSAAGRRRTRRSGPWFDGYTYRH